MSNRTTPPANESEDRESASGEDFASMLEEYGSPQSLRLSVGDRVEGRVIHISETAVFCSLSPTQEAFITREEVMDKEGKLTVAVGDRLEAFVASLKGGIELRRHLGSNEVDLFMLERAREKQLPLEGKVSAVNKGGLEVEVAGARGFCPMGQVDIDFVEDPSALVGQTFEFLVREVREGGRNIVLSRRALLEERRRAAAHKLLSELEVGERRRVTVTRLASFGAFADLGGLDGLIPISEISHATVGHPEEVLSKGQMVEVEVIRIEPDPKGGPTPRIALSLRATLPDPFVVRASDLAEGTELPGKVVRTEKFGAFVEVFPGVQGLVHISEMAARRIRHPRDVVSEGDEINVRVLSLNPEQRRLSLSMREPRETVTANASDLSVGSLVQGTVDRVERYGLFVKLTNGRSGLLPTAETGLDRGGASAGDAFPVGTQLDLQVIGIDERGRIRLSKKERERTEERALVESFNQGDRRGGKGLGTLGDLFAAKLKK